MKRTPLFMFIRSAELENEAGYVLAGALIIDVPPGAVQEGDTQDMILDIVRDIIDHTGRGGNDNIYGWPEGVQPEDVDTLADEATLRAWTEKCVNIQICIKPGEADPRFINTATMKVSNKRLH